MNQPTISVVIPCYNGARFLRETIDSVMAQTYPVLEVLVIDDGSTDNSAAIAESYGPPIRVIRQPNQGESVARNRGIDEAKGDWIAFLDADDLWQPTKLECQMKLPSFSSFASLCTDTEIVHITGIHTADAASYKSSWKARRSSLTPRYVLSNGMPIHLSSLMVKKEVSPRFPTWTRYGEDMIYLLELLKRGAIGIVHQPLVQYMKHSESQSGSNPEIPFRWYESLAEWIDRSQFDKSLAAEYHQYALTFIANKGITSFHTNNRELFSKVCDFLKDHRSPREVVTLHRLNRYPRWLARSLDYLSRIRAMIHVLLFSALLCARYAKTHHSHLAVMDVLQIA